MATKNVTIKQPPPPTDEVATEIIATSIVEIADGIKALRSGRLNERCLLLLIKHACSANVTMTQIKAVLEAAQSLKEQYLRTR